MWLGPGQVLPSPVVLPFLLPPRGGSLEISKSHRDVVLGTLLWVDPEVSLHLMLSGSIARGVLLSAPHAAFSLAVQDQLQSQEELA